MKLGKLVADEFIKKYKSFLIKEEEQIIYRRLLYPRHIYHKEPTKIGWISEGLDDQDYYDLLEMKKEAVVKLLELLVEYYERFTILTTQKETERLARKIAYVNPQKVVYKILNQKVKKIETIKILRETYKKLTTEFILIKRQDNIEIEHNPNNLFAIYEHSREVNPTLCFFVSLLNTFQTLPIDESSYYSYSQSLTTYLLKLLHRKQIIEIIDCQKGRTFDINMFKNILEEKNTLRFPQMYLVEFRKKRDLTSEDIEMIQSIAHLLKIPIPKTKKTFKNLTFEIPKEARNSNLEWLKNIWTQKECYQQIFQEIKKEFIKSKVDLGVTQSVQKRTRVK